MAAPLAYKKKMTYRFSETPTYSINYEKPSTIDYKVEFQNDRLLVIRWCNEGFGAYCTNWADFSYVDLKNLRIVPTSELVKETMLGELSLQLYKVALKKYQAQINLEKKYLRNKKIDAERLERSEETISGYQGCMSFTHKAIKIEGQILKDSVIELETLDTLANQKEHFKLSKNKAGIWQGKW